MRYKFECTKHNTSLKGAPDWLYLEAGQPDPWYLDLSDMWCPIGTQLESDAVGKEAKEATLCGAFWKVGPRDAED